MHPASIASLRVASSSLAVMTMTGHFDPDVLREGGEGLSVCQARPIEEELHLVEKLDPVLLQQHEMCPLAKHDEPLVGAARQLTENRLRALGRGESIPLRDDHQRRDLDPRRIIVWLACLPVIP